MQMTNFLKRKYIRLHLNKSITSSGSGCTYFYGPSAISETAFLFFYLLHQLMYHKVQECLKYLYLLSYVASYQLNKKNELIFVMDTEGMKVVIGKNIIDKTALKCGNELLVSPFGIQFCCADLDLGKDQVQESLSRINLINKQINSFFKCL
jgi:hypothetical protein